MNDEYLPLGRILGAHGVRGYLKYQLDNVMSDSLRPGTMIGLGADLKKLQWFEIEELLTGDRLALVDLDIREEAQKLKGSTIWIRRRDLPKNDDHEIYLVDLIGFDAVDMNNQKLGTITGFSTNGTQPLVEIQYKDQKILLPFIQPILHTMKESDRVVVFDPPDGFFE